MDDIGGLLNSLGEHEETLIVFWAKSVLFSRIFSRFQLLYVNDCGLPIYTNLFSKFVKLAMEINAFVLTNGSLGLKSVIINRLDPLFVPTIIRLFGEPGNFKYLAIIIKCITGNQSKSLDYLKLNKNQKVMESSECLFEKSYLPMLVNKISQKLEDYRIESSVGSKRPFSAIFERKLSEKSVCFKPMGIFLSHGKFPIILDASDLLSFLQLHSYSIPAEYKSAFSRLTQMLCKSITIPVFSINPALRIIESLEKTSTRLKLEPLEFRNLTPIIFPGKKHVKILPEIKKYHAE